MNIYKCFILKAMYKTFLQFNYHYYAWEGKKNQVLEPTSWSFGTDIGEQQRLV